MGVCVGVEKHKCTWNLKSSDSRDGGMVFTEVGRLLLLFFIFAVTEGKPAGERSHTPQTMVRPRPEQDLAGWGVVPGRWRGGPATSTATNCCPGREQGGVWKGGSPSAWSIYRESVGPGGAAERQGDKSGGRGWLLERGAWAKSFTAPGHKTS